jgi:glycosyltransferase involved in cell wall biosynthesis
VDTTYNVCARPFLPPAATAATAIGQGGRRRVLVVDANLRPFGGGQAVTAWTLQALQDAHDVTLLTWERPDFAAINRHYGTRLQPSQLTVRTAPLGHRVARGLVRDPWNTHRKSLVLRHAKAMKDQFDIILCTDNEADFGKPGIQYVHFPGLAQHDPQRGRRDTGTVTSPSRSQRGWMRVSDFSFDRMRRNLTLVNSDWSGNRVRAAYDMPTRTIYPPVGGDFPNVPWAERDDGFICLGRISPEKRIERIIAILGEVRRTRPSVRLHIVGMPGDTADAVQYNRHIRELAAPLPWVKFEGAVSRDRLRDIAAHRRWGIHAMEDEHFGIAIAEMMRAGCIVFAPRSGGQSEILGFEDRLLYPSDEAAVESILNVMGDPLQQEELRRFLASRSEHFTAEAFMDQMRRVVRDFNPAISLDAATA